VGPDGAPCGVVVPDAGPSNGVVMRPPRVLLAGADLAASPEHRP